MSSLIKVEGGKYNNMFAIALELKICENGQRAQIVRRFKNWQSWRRKCDLF